MDFWTLLVFGFFAFIISRNIKGFFDSSAGSATARIVRRVMK